MAGIQARTTRRLASPRTQLSRSAQDMVADWPLNSSDTQAVVSRAARRDVAKHKKLFQDREDLWVIAWLIAPMLPVALAYAVYDSSNLDLYRWLGSDLLVFMVEVIPGLLGASVGLLLAFWWLRVLRPNWLRTVAFEMGHPVCRACSHWNSGNELVERCRECGQRLLVTPSTKAQSLPKDTSELIEHWVIPPDVEDAFLTRYEAIHAGDQLRQRWGRSARRFACALVNLSLFVAGAAVLLFGNKLNGMPDVPPEIKSLVQDHGGFIATGLLILFLTGLWVSSALDQRASRRALVGAALDVELPACPRCLEWCPDANGQCPVCNASLGSQAH